MAGPNEAIAVKSAKAADKDFHIIDKNNDRQLSLTEFSELKLPELSDKKVAEAAFKQIAGERGSVAREDLALFLKNEKELVTEALSRIGNQLMSTQVSASEKVIDEYIKAGGKPNAEIFKEPGFYTRVVGVVKDTFAKQMQADPGDKIVADAMDRSDGWQKEKAQLRQVYFAELEKIMPEVKPSVVQSMIDSATKAKDHQALSAIDFAIVRFAGDRTDLMGLRQSANRNLALIGPSKEPPVLAQVQFHIHRLNEMESIGSQAVVNAAAAVGVSIKDEGFKRGIDFSREQYNRSTALIKETEKNPAMNKDIWFDQKWRETTRDLAQRYSKETSSIVQTATAEQMVALYDKLTTVSPKNADSLIAYMISKSGISVERAETLRQQTVELGYKADPLSEKAGGRLTAALEGYIQSKAEPKK